jgi:hypothetical protein
LMLHFCSIVLIVGHVASGRPNTWLEKREHCVSFVCGIGVIHVTNLNQFPMPRLKKIRRV